MVGDDGSGSCQFEPLTADDLHILFDYDRAQIALDLVTDYIGGALVGGLGSQGPLPYADRQAVEKYCGLWSEVGGTTAHIMLRAKGELKALKWLMYHQAAVKSFARQIDARGTLSGKELVQRLTKTFGPAPTTAGPYEKGA